MELKIFRAFEKNTCPVTGNEEELDPVHGWSLDGLAVKHRRGEIEFEIPWALFPEIGFETRFHQKKISNITFRVLPAGYTKGSMLVNFAEEETWMRNLGEIGRGETPNHWGAFLSQCLRGVELTYLPEDDEEDEWFNFQFQAKVNSEWLSARPPTIAGAVIDVTDVGAGQIKPCEIPVTFRDVDWIKTASFQSEFEELESFSYLTEKFFEHLGESTRISRLVEASNKVSWDTFCRYFGNGHGVLGCLKGERTKIGINLPIPQLEIREFESVSMRD